MLAVSKYRRVLRRSGKRLLGCFPGTPTTYRSTVSMSTSPRSTPFVFSSVTHARTQCFVGIMALYRPIPQHSGHSTQIRPQSSAEPSNRIDVAGTGLPQYVMGSVPALRFSGALDLHRFAVMRSTLITSVRTWTSP